MTTQNTVDQPELKLDDAAARAVGEGLLGFSPKPLGRGDKAYLHALGLTDQQVEEVVRNLRDGMSPLTRAVRNSGPAPI